MTRPIVESLRRWDPERIGRYSIVGRLGAGAMGQVFLARSTAGRLVAVKTIRVELAEEPGFRARFAREVAAARRVSGVFTAAVIEADPEADLPWVATAYVPAPSLSTLVRECGPLPVPAVRWLAAGCAEALQSIHGVGLLHRDVKPSNVLVAPDGPRVIDFGVARAAERVQLTVTREAAGTPSYMAPEQARDATRASPASDVFSLGATLVFAATGQAPYRGDSVMDILVRLATEPPDLASVPEELTDLIVACMARVPRDRPTDAGILASLGSFAHAEPGSGHSYLPDSAMALIAGFQRNLPLTARADNGSDGKSATDDDATGDDPIGEATDDGSGDRSAPDAGTAGSHTALPGFDSLSAFRAKQESPPWQGPPPSRRARRRGLAQGRRQPLVLAGWVAVAVVLIVAGTALGMALRGPGAQTGDPPPPGGPPPSPCPVQSQAHNGGPQLCLIQPYGDGNTVFVVHGSDFGPGAQITVRLVGRGVSPYRPVADRRGTFSYAIDQGHYFFPGAIPSGSYTVVATAPGGSSATASFRVNGPPPGAPPPGGP